MTNPLTVTQSPRKDDDIIYGPSLYSVLASHPRVRELELVVRGVSGDPVRGFTVTVRRLGDDPEKRESVPIAILLHAQPDGLWRYPAVMDRALVLLERVRERMIAERS